MAINDLILYCLVEGQSASNAFYVNAKPTEAVYNLKVHIKTENPNTFIGVDAKDLTLWRVLIPAVNLHSPITVDALDDDNKTELDNPRERLSEVFPNNPDDNTYIFVRRPTGLISESEFLQHVLGAVLGEQQGRDTGMSSSHRTYAFSPSPRSWDILNSVLSMDLDPAPKYTRPQFLEDRVYAPESMLHVLFRHDMGSVRVLPPFADTTQTMHLRCGTPDLVCLRKGGHRDLPESVLFPIEIKRPAELRSENLVEDYEAQEQSGASAGPGDHLRQAFGYMRLNGYRYGVLSTYEQTWFLKRGDQDADHDFMVSPMIAFDRLEPTLLQCYLWLIRQADSDTRPLDPLTETEVTRMLKDEQRRNDKRRKTRESNKKKKSAKDRVSSLFGPKTHSKTKKTDRMILPAFDSMNLISRGEHAQTYKASWGGHNVVVKKCDIWNQRPVVEELKHEARVYQVLRTLQGQHIPELRFAGVADGMEMILVTDFVGSDVSHERLDDSDQEKIRAALSAIHDLGVVHGDIRPQNIVVQHDGPNVRFYIVDFGMSRIAADTTERDWEKDVLDSLLTDMAAGRS
ncbi:hypothetical protein BGX30_009003 [Mortierella sp. GBA39]|nr:hypothetical protein BGX30_009003 [Mortierella sp. GBA39]